MIFPIGDVPNPSGFRPWVTWLLIALNIAIFLLFTLPLSATAPSPQDPDLPTYIELIRQTLPQGASLDGALRGVSAYDLFVFRRGFKPALPELSDLFTAMFLHAGLAHLAGNMLFLWIYGDNVEYRLGRLGFLLSYLTTGMVSTLAFGLIAGPSLTPLIGASGAISGLLGLYFVFFPRNKVKIFVFLFPFVMNSVYLSARVVLAFYLLIDNLLPQLLGAQGGVAYGAHIGGFMAGLVLALPLDRLGLGLSAHTSAADPPVGDDPYSRQRYLELVRAIQRRPPLTEEARLRLDLAALLLRQGHDASAYAHLLRVLELDPDPATEDAARRALSYLDARGGGWMR